MCAPHRPWAGAGKPFIVIQNKDGMWWVDLKKKSMVLIMRAVAEMRGSCGYSEVA